MSPYDDDSPWAAPPRSGHGDLTLFSDYAIESAVELDRTGFTSPYDDAHIWGWVGCTLRREHVPGATAGRAHAPSIADAYIRTGGFKHILVIGSEVHSTESTSRLDRQLDPGATR